LSSVSTEGQPIIVTGAAGFIGAAVARKLAASGRRVIGTDVVAPADPHDGGFAFVRADARDLLRLTALVKDGCDGIIHCGGISGPMLAQDNPGEIFDINIRGTWLLLDLVRCFNLRRFVLCSSVSAYGDTVASKGVTEQEPLKASTAYGSSKASSDLLLQTYVRRYGVSAVCLRLGWVYGPRRRTDGILRPMIRSAIDGPAFNLEQGADHLLQYVHVDDVVAAVTAAYDAPRLKEVAYNVNGGEALTLGAIATSVRAVLPAAQISIRAGMLAETDIQGPMSLRAAAEDLSWQPQIGLTDGLRDYARWLATHSV
jgi:UDP-glucuronate 4-epimerase